MNRSRRLSQPLYDSLPWLYVLAGLIALVTSYFVAFLHVVSLVLGLGGLLAVIGGSVIWLRRRDYRQLRANYSDPDFLTKKTED
ncbi:MAG TPA: hypothetical protein VGM84_08025 [Steroidobacteraceae bacterium]|jgi:nitrate reductase gamma subunit